jgi:Cd2+/Zn2+-exporting ATPase
MCFGVPPLHDRTVGPPDAGRSGVIGRWGVLLCRLSRPRAEFAASTAAGVLLLVGWVLPRLSLPEGRLLIWASLGIGMIYGGRAAAAALRRRQFDIDVLMVLGAGFAAWLGYPSDGALLLFLFVLAGALEDLAMERTRREVEAIHKLMPTAAVVWREGEWTACDPQSLAPGDRVQIRAGELVPADATVLSGITEMDQATLTGESLPRAVGVGDPIYAGTINVQNPIEATVLRPAGQSSLQKVLDLVTKAREQREPVQRFIDRVSQPYALGVVGLSTAVFLVWWLALGVRWEDALYTAITLLIVCSPCALVIATPTATLAAISRAARAGVLFKGGQAIERLARMSAVCFDKTGTLTIGRPRLSQVHAVAWSDGKELLSVAAGLEAASTHPIAAAVREAAAQRGVEAAVIEAVSNTAGRGVTGVLAGRSARLGSYHHTESVIPVCLRNRVQEVLGKMRERGHIGVVVALGGTDGAGGGAGPAPADEIGQAAVLVMSDAVRPGAAELVRELHSLNIRPVRMLTGDNRVTARRVAEALGLDRWDAELLPQDKVAAVEEMKRGARAGGVGVIGDGVNDAPALATSDVSIAIGSIGSDAALESADIVLLRDDLTAVAWAVRLARRARRTIKINFTIALGAIVVMATAALVGSRTGWTMPMWMAVLGHEGGTLLVVLNSLRLLLTPADAVAAHAEAEQAAPDSALAATATA